MPVMFVGHGSPMNVIEDTVYRQSWQDWGSQFGITWPKPQLIVCISAHWLTRGWWLTAMEKPKTIHDFGGFPVELFAQQYPAPGFPAAAAELAQTLRHPVSGEPLGLDADQWGLDHGAWGVLKSMFPAANIPVLQLSIDASQPASAHLALGKQLKVLRGYGVLVLASGNVVHNLRALRRDAPDGQTYDWAQAFDLAVAERLVAHDLTALQGFEAWPHAAQAHPSDEHFLPLLYAAGAVDADEAPRFFNASFQAASISMRSVVWG
jgi:4,5-DOPA dioxygenase extradiol